MYEHDLLAGHPASEELSRELVLAEAQASCARSWADIGIAQPQGWDRQQRAAQGASCKEASAEKILHNDEMVPQHTLTLLIASARKWYRGCGSPEQGAVTYYRMNMLERRAVDLAFPWSNFLTFNGSELRNLLPGHLPIFYMY